MLSEKKIINVLRSEIPYLKRNYGVERIALFGSFAIGKATKASDIDMLVEFKKPLGLAFMDLAEYLEKRLGRKTDILTLEGVRSIRIKKVAQDIKRSLFYV
ncbi:MAG TPA: nucleotidyltransferase domain-containing protein [Candidatus Omnitrophota bacterium]|nr:nucleotidyltransferase domain-containing protein [Candidatus Omnitrophota bacterium]